MAHHTIIYGRINGPGWKPADYYKLHRLNLEVIRNLPDQDTEYPWINKSMFSIANTQGIFRDQVITFGASYKTLEYEWEKWIEKFEKILRTLYWWDVIIHAEFEVLGTYQYEWIANPQLLGEYWDSVKPEPLPEWEFKSNGPRTFKDRR